MTSGDNIVQQKTIWVCVKNSGGLIINDILLDFN
jgi:hypothetical protein